LKTEIESQDVNVGLSHDLPAKQPRELYRRYHIETDPAPDIAPYPSRFLVKVKKHRLAQFLLKELIHYRGDMEVVTSRPCVYGVFSGPVGGFAPRERLCVGCLRCTTQYPDMVQIYHNPERENLGDSYFTPNGVDAVSYEAQTGRISVKGAGYRGKFGGAGWDGMWTDMSEIVRPTRDGIHGREFISTVVDIGEIPSFLTLDEQCLPVGPTPRVISLPLPILLDVPPASTMSKTHLSILSETARETGTLAIMPLSAIKKFGLGGRNIIPFVTPGDRDALTGLDLHSPMIEVADLNETLEIRERFPSSILCLRVPFSPGVDERLIEWFRAGVNVFHLVADYHGRGGDGKFVLDLIRRSHEVFVDAGCRERVTLLGSGGIIAAEHVAKAIICGLDAVALDTPLLVALQAKMLGECFNRETSQFSIPATNHEWSVQRLKNLLASWGDQLLEVLGAMGLREVRRLRGELGRAMFQQDLEREAFGEISGYANS
jgi:hypothetical protein